MSIIADQSAGGASVPIGSHRLPDPIHLLFNSEAQLKNEIMVEGTKHRQILGFVATALAQRFYVMEMKPTIVCAAIPGEIGEGALPLGSSNDRVPGLSRESFSPPGL